MLALLRPVTRTIALGLLAVACAATPGPTPAAPAPGSPSPAPPTESPTATHGLRLFVVAVNNGSRQPATLVVGEDGTFNGHPTGTVDPSVLPPGITEDVIIGVPPSAGWAIYVNPGPDWGASITWRDVPPDAAGRMPFTIVIGVDGSGGADANPPGWFGNPLSTPGPTASTPPPAVPGPGWAATGEMGGPRRDHTATLLRSGRVLVIGGSDDYDRLASTDRFDPSTGSWSSVGKLAVARTGHTATLLRDGTVLVTGGFDDRTNRVLGSSETFDPKSGTWTPAGKMVIARTAHTATLLPDGRVLVVGGSAFGGHGEAIRDAELYDPGSRSWTATKRPLGARWGHTATLLPDGRVLIVGGVVGLSQLASAELYDPTNGSWAATGSMNAARAKFTATLLLDGTVLVAGSARRSAEIFDPGSGAWAATGRTVYARGNYPTATRLPDGRVLMTGGAARDAEGDWMEAFAELYDPVSRSWARAGNPLTARFSHTATLLPDGTVLIVGGTDLDGALATAEIYDPTLPNS